jgi:hypothetical protein
MRIENPAALMGWRARGHEAKEWVLIVNDIRGREVDSDTATVPTLRGVRAYRSFYDVPNERIHHMQKAFKERCINIGDGLPIIADCAIMATNACLARQR